MCSKQPPAHNNEHNKSSRIYLYDDDDSQKTLCMAPKSDSSLGINRPKSGEKLEMLKKEPGWRRNECSSVSNTSISSTGNLKQFLKAPEKIAHTPRIKFELNEKLANDALQTSFRIGELTVREPSLLSMDPVQISPGNRALYWNLQQQGIPLCPLDIAGGFKSIAVIKSVPEGDAKRIPVKSEANHNSPTPRSHKSPQLAHPKTAPPPLSSSENPSSQFDSLVKSLREQAHSLYTTITSIINTKPEMAKSPGGSDELCLCDVGKIHDTIQLALEPKIEPKTAIDCEFDECSCTHVKSEKEDTTNNA